MPLNDNILEFSNKLAASKVKQIDLDSPVQLSRLGLAFLEVAVAENADRAATEDRIVAELEEEFSA